MLMICRLALNACEHDRTAEFMVDRQRRIQAVLVAGKRLGSGFGVVMVEAVAELAEEGGKGGGMMQHAGGAAGGQRMGPRFAIITRVRVRPRQKGRALA